MDSDTDVSETDSHLFTEHNGGVGPQPNHSWGSLPQAQRRIYVASELGIPVYNITSSLLHQAQRCAALTAERARRACAYRQWFVPQAGSPHVDEAPDGKFASLGNANHLPVATAAATGADCDCASETPTESLASSVASDPAVPQLANLTEQQAGMSAPAAAEAAEADTAELDEAAALLLLIGCAHTASTPPAPDNRQTVAEPAPVGRAHHLGPQQDLPPEQRSEDGPPQTLPAAASFNSPPGTPPFYLPRQPAATFPAAAGVAAAVAAAAPTALSSPAASPTTSLTFTAVPLLQPQPQPQPGEPVGEGLGTWGGVSGEAAGQSARLGPPHPTPQTELPLGHLSSDPGVQPGGPGGQVGGGQGFTRPGDPRAGYNGGEGPQQFQRKPQQQPPLPLPQQQQQYQQYQQADQLQQQRERYQDHRGAQNCTSLPQPRNGPQQQHLQQRTQPQQYQQHQRQQEQQPYRQQQRQQQQHQQRQQQRQQSTRAQQDKCQHVQQHYPPPGGQLPASPVSQQQPQQQQQQPHGQGLRSESVQRWQGGGQPPAQSVRQGPAPPSPSPPSPPPPPQHQHQPLPVDRMPAVPPHLLLQAPLGSGRLFGLNGLSPQVAVPALGQFQQLAGVPSGFVLSPAGISVPTTTPILAPAPSSHSAAFSPASATGVRSSSEGMCDPRVWVQPHMQAQVQSQQVQAHAHGRALAQGQGQQTGPSQQWPQPFAWSQPSELSYEQRQHLLLLQQHQFLLYQQLELQQRQQHQHQPQPHEQPGTPKSPKAQEHSQRRNADAAHDPMRRNRFSVGAVGSGNGEQGPPQAGPSSSGGRRRGGWRGGRGVGGNGQQPKAPGRQDWQQQGQPQPRRSPGGQGALPGAPAAAAGSTSSSGPGPSPGGDGGGRRNQYGDGGSRRFQYGGGAMDGLHQAQGAPNQAAQRQGHTARPLGFQVAQPQAV